jgi:hypothetical protein
LLDENILLNLIFVKVNAAFTPEQIMKAQRESRGIALLFL